MTWQRSTSNSASNLLASVGIPTAMDMIWAFKERLFVIQCRKSLHEVADLSNPVVRGTGFRGILTRLWGCPLQEVRVGLPLFQGGSLSEHRRLSEACTIALVRISRRSFWLPLSLRIVGPSGQPVFPGAGGAAGMAGLLQLLQRLSDLACRRLSCSRSRRYSMRSGVWFLCRSYSSLSCLLASTSAGFGSVRCLGFPGVVAFGSSCPCLSGSGCLPPADAECYLA